eukprot:3551906-Alexandrium_andersonii.AAC.1
MARVDERVDEHLAQRLQADVEAAPAPVPRPAAGTGAASSSDARQGPEESESRPELVFTGGGPAASETHA